MYKLRCLRVGAATAQGRLVGVKYSSFSTLPSGAHAAVTPPIPAHTLSVPTTSTPTQHTALESNPSNKIAVNVSATAAIANRVPGHYEGELVDGKRVGFGKLVLPDGSLYEGCFANNMKDGNGRMCFRNGAVFEGEWVEDKQIGYGVATDALGNVRKGQFEDCHLKDGYGVRVIAEGGTYEGSWQNFRKHGMGKITHADGSVSEGEFRKGKIYNGTGAFFSQGVILEGTWVEGVMQGEGRVILTEKRRAQLRSAALQAQSANAKKIPKSPQVNKAEQRHKAQTSSEQHTSSITVPSKSVVTDGLTTSITTSTATLTKSHTATETAPQRSHPVKDNKNKPSPVPAITAPAAKAAPKAVHITATPTDAQANASANAHAHAIADAISAPFVPHTISSGPTGKGVLVLDNGTVYSGEWLNGNMVGLGRVVLGSRPSVQTNVNKVVFKNNTAKKPRVEEATTVAVVAPSGGKTSAPKSARTKKVDQPVDSALAADASKAKGAEGVKNV